MTALSIRDPPVKVAHEADGRVTICGPDEAPGAEPVTAQRALFGGSRWWARDQPAGVAVQPLLDASPPRLSGKLQAHAAGHSVTDDSERHRPPR